MRLLLTVLSLVFASSAFAQNKLLWSADYELTLSDFRSPATRIDSALNQIYLMPGTTTEFGFQMSTYEYMATRNFDDKVSASFTPATAAIKAPDAAAAQRLLDYERYQFDLAELCVRKMRRTMYDNKKVFSDFSLFEPIFQRYHHEMEVEAARVNEATNFGENAELLAEERSKVRAEIETMPDFCYACKPEKVKKGKARG